MKQHLTLDKKEKEQHYQDVFICNQEENWHDFYYESDKEVDLHDYEYQLNRAGIEIEMPSVFVIEREKFARFSIIVCVISGEGFLTVDDEKYLLRKGTVFMLPPEKKHTYSSNPSNPFGLVWMEFYGGDSTRLMRHIVEKNSPIIEGTICEVISAKITMMIQKLEEGRKHVAIEVYAILLELLNHNHSVEQENATSETLKKAIYYIDAHIGEVILNEQLAEICHMSKVHFIRLFKEQFHRSPRTYIMDKKIQISKHYLLYSKESIESIASMLGFCSASHYIRVFKSIEKNTPKQYRVEGKNFSL